MFIWRQSFQQVHSVIFHLVILIILEIFPSHTQQASFFVYMTCYWFLCLLFEIEQLNGMCVYQNSIPFDWFIWKTFISTTPRRDEISPVSTEISGLPEWTHFLCVSSHLSNLDSWSCTKKKQFWIVERLRKSSYLNFIT